MPANIFAFNLIELGHFAAILAMVASLVLGLLPLLARGFQWPRLNSMSNAAALVTFFLTTVGGFILIHAFVSSNFSVAYVAQNSNRALPDFYKVTALWGSHEGSLYLWVWILTLFTAMVAWHGRERYPNHLPVVLSVQGWLMVGFFGLILFLSSPFERLLPMPADGHDLNPLLQDPGMAFHPPMLYLGYVGYSVPFAFAIAALLTRWRSELWVGLIRFWAIIAWVFLTIGIVLGGWWAYYELGWGGYWAWDPVENASFMPWLLGTALLHSVTVQEHRRMLHSWNTFLVITTFSLSLLGTFLVRSGVLSSVHAFAVDPGRGTYILTFMALVLSISFGIFLVQGRYQQAEERITSFLSRESMFVWNNVVFTLACACVMLGTLYPLALEALTGAKITVGAPYFNAVMVPIFLVVILLMAIGPLVPWRKANPAKLKQRLLWPAAAGGLSAVLALLFLWPVHWTGVVAILLTATGLLVLAQDLVRAVQARRKQRRDENIVRATGKVVLAGRRHYGGMTVHLGMLVMAIGLVGSGLFRSELSVSMAPGDEVTLAGLHVRFDGVRQFEKDNYQAVQGQFVLTDSGNVVRPERRKYPRQEAPTTETGIHSTLLRDVYVVLAESNGANWGVHLYINPLIQFIWLGGLISICGALLALTTRLGTARKRIPGSSEAEVRAHG